MTQCKWEKEKKSLKGLPEFSKILKTSVIWPYDTLHCYLSMTSVS